VEHQLSFAGRRGTTAEHASGSRNNTPSAQLVLDLLDASIRRSDSWAICFWKNEFTVPRRMIRPCALKLRAAQ
jgi:hypothetical protein